MTDRAQARLFSQPPWWPGRSSPFYPWALKTDLTAIGDKVSDAGFVGQLPGGEQQPLSAFLRTHQRSARYEVAAESATQIGSLIVQDARPIVVLTTYDARVYTSIAKLKHLIAEGKVRYAFLNTFCGHHASAINAACSAPAQWIRRHGTDVSHEAGLPTPSSAVAVARSSPDERGIPERAAGAVSRSAHTSGRLALDTEFMGEGRYRTLLCLIQLAVPVIPGYDEEIAIFDPLDEQLDLSPLAEALEDPEVQIVLHAGRQDVALLRRALDCEVTNLFDTQIAAGFAGLGAQSSYDSLLGEVLGLRLAKSASFTRWDARPLSAEQRDMHARTCCTCSRWRRRWKRNSRRSGA